MITDTHSLPKQRIVARIERAFSNVGPISTTASCKIATSRAVVAQLAKAARMATAGKATFAAKIDVEIDLSQHHGGDNLCDYEINGKTIDAETTKRVNNLLLEPGKRTADNLVLAQYDEETRTARPIGWEYPREMVTCPIRKFGTLDFLSHFKLMYKLSIKSLKHLLPRLWGLAAFASGEDTLCGIGCTGVIVTRNAMVLSRATTRHPLSSQKIHASHTEARSTISERIKATSELHWPSLR